MEYQMSEHKTKLELHPSIQRHAPKRENFETQDEYEEAVAFFKHRTKHLLRASSPQ